MADFSLIMNWLFASFVILQISWVVGVCDSDWFSSGLYCYHVSNYTATYKDAQQACQQAQAEVVYIDDFYENELVAAISASATGEMYWIGYEHIIGTIWRWAISGKTGLFAKWEPGEPDGQGKCSCITSHNNGDWRDRDCNIPLRFICKKHADCGSPPPMPNGEDPVTSLPALNSKDNIIYAAFTIAQYMCAEGYEYADGSQLKRSKCEIGGKWLPNVPMDDPCVPKKCAPPPQYDFTVSNVRVSAQYYPFGSVVTYSCAPGYWFHPYEDRIKKKYLKCESDKTWQETDQDPDAIPLDKCSKRHCVRPITSNSVSNSSLNIFGTVAMYKCNEGFKYRDNETAKVFTCGKDAWQPSAEKCIIKRCARHSVRNAVGFPDSVDFDTTVVWTCLPGHKYPDTSTRKSMYCQANEQWAGKIMSGCETMPCLNPPTNASTTNVHNWNASKTYKYLDNITYTCIHAKEGWTFPSEDSTKEPSSTRTAICGPNAEWEPKYIGDCTGDPVVIETKHAVVPPKEHPQAIIVGSLGYIIIAALFVVIIVLDLLTFGKSLSIMKENLHPPVASDEDVVATQLAKWKSSLANKKKPDAGKPKTVISDTKKKKPNSGSKKLTTLREENEIREAKGRRGSKETQGRQSASPKPSTSA